MCTVTKIRTRKCSCSAEKVRPQRSLSLECRPPVVVHHRIPGASGDASRAFTQESGKPLCNSITFPHDAVQAIGCGPWILQVCIAFRFEIQTTFSVDQLPFYTDQVF